MALSIVRSRCLSAAATSSFACGSVKAGFFPPQAHSHQKEVSQEGLRHVVVPPSPGPHFVVVHSHFPLGFLEGRLDRPAHPAHPRQLLLRHASWRVREKVLHLPIFETSAQYQG